LVSTKARPAGRTGRGDHVGAAAAPLVDEGKVRIVEEAYLPGNSVSLVARRHGIAGNQLFTYRRLR